MANADEFIGGVTGSLISFAGVTVADVDHWVSIACGIAGILITIVTTVVIPFIKRIKKAKEDGRITIDEIEDIANKTKEDIDRINKEK